MTNLERIKFLEDMNVRNNVVLVKEVYLNKKYVGSDGKERCQSNLCLYVVSTGLRIPIDVIRNEKYKSSKNDYINLVNNALVITIKD